MKDFELPTDIPELGTPSQKEIIQNEIIQNEITHEGDHPLDSLEIRINTGLRASIKRKPA